MSQNNVSLLAIMFITKYLSRVHGVTPQLLQRAKGLN